MEMLNKSQLVKAFSGKSLFIKAAGDGYIRTTRKELLSYIKRGGFNKFSVLIATNADNGHQKLYIDDAGRN